MVMLDLRQAASYLGIQPRTLRAWINQTKRGERGTAGPGRPLPHALSKFLELSRKQNEGMFSGHVCVGKL